MRKRDSFAVGMFVTFGILVALLLAGVAAVGAFAYRMREVDNYYAHKSDAKEALDKQAMQVAETILKQNGLIEFSDHCGVAETDGETWLVGSAKDAQGDIHKFGVQMDKATFGKTVQLKILLVSIDSRTVYNIR